MRLALLILALLVAPAIAAPSRAHPLDDAAKVVPDADQPALEAELADLKTAGVDMAVIVINTTGGQSIEAYARAQAKAWATGTTPAAVFVLAIKDRKSRLEVSDPLRGKFPDARAQSILDNIKGYLRSSDFTGAIRAVIAEVKAGVAGVAPDLESPHPQVPDPSDNAFTPTPSTTPPPAAPEPSYTPSYETPKRPINWGAIVGAVLVGGLFVGGANLWARSRIASRATLSANGTITSDRGLFGETLWCMMLIIGGLLYIAAIVAFSASSSRSSSSSSSWGSFGGGSSSSGGGSSGGGGWSGGGASSSW